MIVVFFFKKKTAYEILRDEWRSDMLSFDVERERERERERKGERERERERERVRERETERQRQREACRERV